ncbi:MAG: sodium:calcium antiporter, partial [Bdellovibrio sp.]
MVGEKMNVWPSILGIIGGFVLLLLGGEGLVRAAVSIAARLKVSAIVIGLTVVAAGTSAPELLTSFLAAFKGIDDISVGNVIGSNIFNLLVILGISALVRPFLIKQQDFKWDVVFLLTSTFFFFVFLFTHREISRLEGGLFLLALSAYFLVSVGLAKKGHRSEIAGELQEEIKTLRFVWQDILFLVGGSLFLIYGAQLVLSNSLVLGRFFGISERILGLTVVSVGTGLPELATSFVASLRGQSHLAAANVVGSNIINTLGVIG